MRLYRLCSKGACVLETGVMKSKLEVKHAEAHAMTEAMCTGE